MVIGYHLIFTAYGWWLPNDPRGSSSHEIRDNIIARLGELHHGRKHIQPNGRDIRDFYSAARGQLRHQLRTFNDDERSLIACGFGRTIRRRGYMCYACAIMPDHVHLLVRKHRDTAEQMIGHLQDDSAAELTAHGCSAPDHPVWGGPGWKVFLNEPADVERTVRYIRDNPLPYRMPMQTWQFVAPYDGWPVHHRSQQV